MKAYPSALNAILDRTGIFPGAKSAEMTINTAMRPLHLAPYHHSLASTSASTHSKTTTTLDLSISKYSHSVLTFDHLRAVKMACPSCCTRTITTFFVCSCGYREATRTVITPTHSSSTGFVAGESIISCRSSRSSHSSRSSRSHHSQPSVVVNERRSSRSGSSQASRTSHSQSQGQDGSRVGSWLDSVPEGAPASARSQRLLPAPESHRSERSGLHVSRHSSVSSSSRLSSRVGSASSISPADSASQVSSRHSRSSSCYCRSSEHLSGSYAPSERSHRSSMSQRTSRCDDSNCNYCRR
ncbi:hypothetical protein BDV59DRAFT_169162 [Aspergillus ambiguus]|uniref:uncharacterized protein n=1 Tax=Aspergillus ambiguus TaxID=176160 RepID=UPI003CCE52D3